MSKAITELTKLCRFPATRGHGFVELLSVSRPYLERRYLKHFQMRTEIIRGYFIDIESNT